MLCICSLTNDGFVFSIADRISFQLKKEAGKNCFKYYSLFFLQGKVAITKLLLQRNKMLYTMIYRKLPFTSVLKKTKIFLIYIDRCWKTRELKIWQPSPCKNPIGKVYCHIHRWNILTSDNVFCILQFQFSLELFFIFLLSLSSCEYTKLLLNQKRRKRVQNKACYNITLKLKNSTYSFKINSAGQLNFFVFCRRICFLL